MKKCSKCGELKEYSEFSKHKKKDILRNWCKDCVSLNNSRDIEYKKLYAKVYYRNNIEKFKDYYKNNKEKFKLSNKNSRYKNLNIQNRRREMIFAVNEVFTECDINKTREIFGYKCFNCGSSNKLCIDHHYPLSYGYRLEHGNAVCLCKTCNSSKHNKLPCEFYDKDKLKKLNNILNLIIFLTKSDINLEKRYEENLEKIKKYEIPTYINKNGSVKNITRNDLKIQNAMLEIETTTESYTIFDIAAKLNKDIENLRKTLKAANYYGRSYSVVGSSHKVIIYSLYKPLFPVKVKNGAIKRITKNDLQIQNAMLEIEKIKESYSVADIAAKLNKNIKSLRKTLKAANYYGRTYSVEGSSHKIVIKRLSQPVIV